MATRWHNRKFADDAYPRTWRELFWYFYNNDLHRFHVFKEGPKYAVRIGTRIGATHVRNIDSLTFAGWRRMCEGIEQGYTPLWSA